MCAVERGLGRGLDSLFRPSSTVSDTETVKDISKLALSQLVTGQHQPRKFFEESALKDLSVSIKNQGIVQPLVVRPKAETQPQLYEIVAGERRWRAAKLAGLTEVPVIIQNYTDVEAMTVALVENLQRENLNPLEEAEALQALREAHSFSQEELAGKLGKSRSAVTNALRLLQLPEAMQQGLAKAAISAGHGRALLALTDGELQKLLYQAILDQHLSVRESEAAVDFWRRTQRLPETCYPAISLEKADENAGKVAHASRAPKSARLKFIQKQLRKQIHHGVCVSGTEEKGKIALPYTSREELDHFLHLLGMEESAPGISTEN